MSVVYFIQAGEGGMVKIGWAKNLRVRLTSLQTGCPEPLAVLAAIEGGQTVERRYHRALAAFRVRGEWFHPSQEVVAAAEAAKLGTPPALDGSCTIAALMERFGGLKAFAKLVDVPMTTAAGWRDANQIPRYRQAAVIEAVSRAGGSIATTDFPPARARARAT